MPASAQVERLDHRDAGVAAEIHVVWTLAYAQEARLLRIANFAPLDRTVQDIRDSEDCFLGARDGERLAGVACFGPDDEAGQFIVSALVVDPQCQRRGVARLLMTTLIRLAGGFAVAVSTAEANLPALALYRGLGFIAYRFGTVGPERLPLVKLRRPSSLHETGATP